MPGITGWRHLEIVGRPVYDGGRFGARLEAGGGGNRPTLRLPVTVARQALLESAGGAMSLTEAAAAGRDPAEPAQADLMRDRPWDDA
jgi:hypothetical protein